MRLTFHVDSRYCSGCKSCQLACKDKNNLPVGQLWRRVYEVTSGQWTARGKAWLHSITAYNISLSCNHCEKCICQEVCPAKAYKRDENGIVWIDQDRCMGCKYCTMACPYGAPQFNPILGRMGKCDFCRDRIQQGQAPVCVKACPMRIISWGEHQELKQRFESVHQIFPLPNQELTEPSLLITPHRDAANKDSFNLDLANPEEV